jgi:hypothetical protein
LATRWIIRVSNPDRDKGFSYSMDAGVLCREYSGRDVKLTTHLHLAPRLRISGVIPLLPLYAFVA